MKRDYQQRLRQIEKALGGKDVSDVILITLEDGTTERWQDIDLTLTVFGYPELDIRINDGTETALAEHNLPIEYQYEKAHPFGFAQYQMWLIYWLDLMCDTAKRRKGVFYE